MANTLRIATAPLYAGAGPARETERLATLISLPFKGGEWDMVIFHPDDMGAFLAALTPESQ
jgi:hypothetical protein